MALILSGGDGGNATITGNSGNLTIANAGNIVTGSAVLSSSGNVTGGNIITTGVVSSTGNIIGANIMTSGLMSIAGNITANYILGNGSAMTGVASFATGTVMLFKQTAAPTGWTKSVSFNDHALRVVSGTAGNGGGVAFSTAFSNTTVGNTTLSTDQIPSHAHITQIVGGPGTPASYYYGSTWGGPTPMINTGTAGGGNSHNHSMTMAVQYVDVIIATKD